MATKRIPLSAVKVGMYLCEIDRSWIDTPFLKHRFLIESPADLAKLQQCGVQEITIDTDRGLDVTSIPEAPQDEEGDLISTPTSSDPPLPIPSAVDRIQDLPPTVQGKSLAGELMAMRHTRQHMLNSVQDILQTLAKTGGMAVEQVNQLTQDIIAETLDHEEAYIALIRTREFSPALYDHALAVSTLAVLLGRAVELNETELQHRASAGLFHDAGLIKIPESIHRPLQQLSESELGVFQSHPRRGLEFLTQQSNLSDEVQTLISEHHINLDGSGYPANLDPTTIHTSSRILRLVDEYDELLSGQHTGKSQSVRAALQSLYQQGKKGVLDAKLVASFITLIGIYPTYSLVELSTGERGIVTANSRENLLHPTILLIQDANHQPLPDPIPFNFSVMSVNSPSPEIVQILPPEQVGVNLDSVLENWVTL